MGQHSADILNKFCWVQTSIDLVRAAPPRAARFASCKFFYLDQNVNRSENC
jgi:hypothetical protein